VTTPDRSLQSVNKDKKTKHSSETTSKNEITVHPTDNHEDEQSNVRKMSNNNLQTKL
jgi:hypothetical protein